jgi:hypothetical protein
MPFALKPPEGTAGSAVPAILTGLFVAFGGILYGYARNYSFNDATRH